MAARENQGLQIALIVCAMLVIGLGVFAFVLNNNSKDEALRTASAESKAKAASDTLTKAVEEMGQLKLLMGYGARDEVPTILANYKKDVESYAATMRESEQNYRNIVSQLATELQKQSALLVDAELRNEQMQSDFNNKEKSNLAEIEKYKAGLNQSKEELEQERSNFNEARDKLKAQDAEYARKFEDRRKKFDEEVAKNAKDLDATETSLRNTLESQEKLAAKLKNQELSTELTDGKVTWVNQNGRLVWLNLGSEDGLRRQISFTVMASDVINPVKAVKKGTIEVTRILDGHLAEARIMDDDPSNPIMPGDQLFSAAWQPGHAEHFALVGLMDLDKDGVSDLDKVRNLITVNGGVVDAELKDDGTRVGQMTVDTNFLVQGDQPTDKSNKSSDYFKNYSEMRRESTLLPIKTISLADLVGYLGYKDRERTVPLGADAKPSDFRPRAPNEVPRHSNNESFKKRRNTPKGKNDVIY
ncbi:MAG TPA: hypothetical protein VHY91_13700 [Pirellulales bacterium]|nr:hypothetical protein [Pirellulales bacterium]